MADSEYGNEEEEAGEGEGEAEEAEEQQPAGEGGEAEDGGEAQAEGGEGDGASEEEAPSAEEEVEASAGGEEGGEGEAAQSGPPYPEANYTPGPWRDDNYTPGPWRQDNSQQQDWTAPSWDNGGGDDQAAAKQPSTKGPPAGYVELGAFKLTAYVCARESDFPSDDVEHNPSWAPGRSFRKPFLYKKHGGSPYGVMMEGSGQTLQGDYVNYDSKGGFQLVKQPMGARGPIAPGRSVAVDRHVISLGTHLWIEGVGERVAEDTGGGIKGNHIDIYYGATLSAREADRLTFNGRKVYKKP
jgi:hypothetical protein